MIRASGEERPAESRGVGRSIAAQLAGRAIAAGMGILTAALLTRALTTSGFGRFEAGMAALGMVVVFHDFGFERIASRRIARRPDEAGSLLGALLVARLLVAPILALVAVGLLIATGERGELLLWTGGAFLVVLALRAVEGIDVILQVEQEMVSSVVASRVGGLFQLVVVFALAELKVTTPGPYFGAIVGGAVVSTVLRLRAVEGLVTLRPRWDPPTVRAFFREAWPVGIMAVLMVVYLQIDTLLVRAIAGPRETGQYRAAYRLFLFAASVPGLVMVSMAPVLSARWVDDRASFRRVALRMTRRLAVAALAFAVVGALIAAPVLGLLFGARYEVAAPTLRWLAFAAAGTWPATVAIGALISADRERVGIKLAAAALALNVVLDLALIPELGASGAAIATLATETVVAVAAYLILDAVTRDAAP